MIFIQPDPSLAAEGQSQASSCVAEIQSHVAQKKGGGRVEAQKIQTLRDLTYLFPRKLHERKINHSCYRSYHTEWAEEFTVGKTPKQPAEVSRRRGPGVGSGGRCQWPRGGCRPGPHQRQSRGGAPTQAARLGWGQDRGGRVLTGAVGLAFQDVQLGAVSQRVLQAELEETGLGLAHALEQRQQRNSLLALVPTLKPARQHPDLVAKHHG